MQKKSLWRRTLLLSVSALLLMSLVFVSGSSGAKAASSVWDEALLAQQEQFQTLVDVSEQFRETGTQLDFQLIEDVIAVGIEQTVAITPEPCMLTWWAYVRSSWEMAAVAQSLVRSGNGETYGYIMYGAGFLAGMAEWEAKKVVCP